MPSIAKKLPRPYLLAPVRRGHLLQAAGRLVRQGGWPALSMQGLAVAAGVSRQLVYEHFGSVEELYLAVLTHLFERAHEATVGIVQTGMSPEATVRAAYDLLLDLPVEEQRALRALAGGEERGAPQFRRAKTRLRTRMAAIWIPYVRLQTGVSDAEAGALAWMLITAGWGLADTISAGTIDRPRGVELFVRFVGHTLATWSGVPIRTSDRHATATKGG